MTTFKKGDQVTKFTGDYWFDGEVRSVMTKKSGAVRYDVEDDRGLIHIFSGNNLRKIGNWADHQYLRVLHELVTKGVQRPDRTGTGTRGLFGKQLRFDLQEGFPLLTTKRLSWKSILVELLWFIRGDTNIKFLHDHGVTIWDEWADENGDLGPVYGKQWRNWNGYEGQSYRIDQLENVINGLKTDPYGRRHIVTAWNPEQINDMALPPCHTMFQFHVAEGKLNCQLYQRSADWFLGVPFNLGSYALLTMLVAREVGLIPGEFVHTFGDLHLYNNHVEQAELQLTRAPKALPSILLNAPDDVSMFDLEPKHFELVDYDPHPKIKAEVSV